MINASSLLQMVPNLPNTTKDILNRLVELGGNPEIHIPGLPSLPSIPSQMPAVLRDAIVAMLGKFEFEFYQTIGVRVTVNGQHIGGVGAKLSETLNVASPVPNLKVIPVLELGAPKD